MGDRIKRLVEGPLIDRAIALVALVGLASFMALFGSIAQMAVEYPAPLGAVCAACFLLGVLLSYLLGIRDARAERARTESARAEQSARHERWVDSLRRRCASLSPSQRDMLRSVMDRGTVTFDMMSTDAGVLAESGLVCVSKMGLATKELVLCINPDVSTEVFSHMNDWLSPDARP